MRACVRACVRPYFSFVRSFVRSFVASFMQTYNVCVFRAVLIFIGHHKLEACMQFTEMPYMLKRKRPEYPVYQSFSFYFTNALHPHNCVLLLTF